MKKTTNDGRRADFLRLLPAGLGACVMAAALLLVPQTAADGVRSGLSLCAQVVIPSLFPFLALSAFLVRAGLAQKLGKLCAPLTRLLFRLPGCAAGAVAMSLVGGFPVGTRMTAQLYEQGLLTQNEAKRMMLFCVNAGPAFVISAVGAAMLGSSRAGVLLYASLALSALVMGFLTRFYKEPSKKQPQSMPGPPVRRIAMSDAFVGAAADASGAMFSICAWVVLFTCLNALISLLPLGGSAASAVFCVLEATSGCASAAHRFPLPVLAAALGWAGLSVQCQVLPAVRKTGLSPAAFLAGRALCAVLSALICAALLLVFPCEAPAFSNFVTPVAAPYSISLPAAAGLMMMGALLILEVDTSRELC